MQFSRSSQRTFRNALCAAIVIVALVSTGWALRHTLHRRALADGTVAVFNAASEFEPAQGYPNPRTLTLNGEFWLTVTAAAAPLTIHTRLLALSVDGKSALHIVARSHDTGEQVEVLYGTVTAHKNYPSNDSEPDHLEAGDMSMVNQSIDLMEKEKLNHSELRALQDKFR